MFVDVFFGRDSNCGVGVEGSGRCVVLLVVVFGVVFWLFLLGKLGGSGWVVLNLVVFG